MQSNMDPLYVLHGQLGGVIQMNYFSFDLLYLEKLPRLATVRFDCHHL